jgi:hypothetical protein
MRPPETVYRGERLYDGQLIAGVRVTVNGRVLSPHRSQKLRNHSPTGFEWGYRGTGPAQLALALVLDATGHPLQSLAAYQWFKVAVVSNFDHDTWEITAGEIHKWVEQFQRECRAESAGAKGGAS